MKGKFARGNICIPEEPESELGNAGEEGHGEGKTPVVVRILVWVEVFPEKT